MSKKRALVTGVTGMDGSHLADFLLEKDYEVYGMIRRTSTPNTTNIKHLEKDVVLLTGDLADQMSIKRCVEESNPDEVYNLASQSFVKESWNTPEYSGNITGLGVLRVLEAIRETNPKIKLYQASSSEMFGKMIENPATENTPFYPRSPYGISKLFGHWMVKNYRESYDMFTCSGILFNHESERRGIEFVTRKITNGVAKIHLGLQNHITLGNLDAKRDWGYSPDYVEAMWLMMQQDIPDDFVIATGRAHTIKDFLTIAFFKVGINNWEKYIKQDERYMRPAEVDVLRGDPTKAIDILNWKSKTSFEEMIGKMIKNDILLESKRIL